MLAKVKKVNKEAVIFLRREGTASIHLGKIDRSKKVIKPADNIETASTLKELITFLEKYPNAKAIHHPQAKPSMIIALNPLWLSRGGKKQCYAVEVIVEKKKKSK